MGGLASGVRRFFGEDDEKVLVTLGLDYAGKTTLIFRMEQIFGSTLMPGCYYNMEAYGVKNYRIFIFDLDNRDYRNYWKSICPNILGIIFVFDASDRNSIEKCKNLLHIVASEREAGNLPILIYANKQDLPDPMKTAEIIDALELRALPDTRWNIQESSAIRNDGIGEGFQWLETEINR